MLNLSDERQSITKGYPYGANNPKRIDLDRVDAFTPADYGLTADAIKSYMFGVSVINPETGQEMPDTFFNHIIESKIAYAEDKLDIAILPRVIAREHHDYYSNNYNSFNYLDLYKRPILQVESLKLNMNNYNIIDYPSDWWKIYTLGGQLQIFPSPLMQATGLMPGSIDGGGMGALGIPMAWLGSQNLVSGDYAPQAFDVDYVAGMLPPERAGMTRDFEFPMDLQQLIIKYSLKEIFQVWGRLIIGAGIASRGLSIDGISENIVTTQSAMYTGSRADIDIIDDDIGVLEAALQAKFAPSMTII